MKLSSLLLTIALALFAVSANAGDPEAGKQKAATCVACHGPEGISTNPEWPNLAGQKEQYLINQMKAYRDGERESPLMAPMAAGLSDADIENLAAYYAGL